MAGSPEVRLKRFLHYGSELPFYNASRSLLKFTDKSCPSIHTLIAAGKEKEVGLQIIKAHSDGYAVHREALLHAMALCALNKTASSLREMTYNAVKTVCVKPEDFFLFVTYLHDLNNSKINSGNGLKRAISDWYLKKDVMEFAEIVSKKKGYYRWTHVDLMKIAHIKTDDPAKQAVIQFVFSGGNVKELREKFKNVKEAQPVLQYLKVAAEVRTSNDAKMVSRAIESNSLTVSHLPQHNKNVMYSDEVWCSLMTGMPLEEMLDQLQFVSRHQLLRPARGCTRNLTRRYCDAVSNVKTLAESNVHPARVLIELSTYNLIAKEKIGLATKLKHTTAIRKPPPTNEQIIEELTKVMDSAFKLLVPTGQSYVVAIDTRSKMWVKRCWKNRYVTCADAAALLALSVVRCERDVTVGMYAGANSPFKVVEVAKDTTLSALVAHMKKHQQDELAVDTAATTSTTEAATTTTTNVDNTMKLLAACINDSMKTQIASQMLDWAEQNKRSVDVFLALGDNQLSTLNLATKLNHYRSVMRLQNAKLVHVHLNGPAKCEAKSKGSGILAVHGFDKNVPRVIEAFARGAF